jgi:serine protease
MESTSNGTQWSKDNLGNGLTSIWFSAAIDSGHTGLVIGTGGTQAWGYPLMAAQSVTFSLKPATIKKGQSATASGTGTPAGAGRLVTLQIERSGRWYSVATTKESGTGSFSFTIKGTSAGKFSYRAVVSEVAGYLQYGYSAAKTLQVTS